MSQRRHEAAHSRYLVFLDGDCVAPPNFLREHMRLREVGKVVAGFTCHLDQQASSWLDEDKIIQGSHRSWADRTAYRKLSKLDRKANFYRLLQHHSKPRLRGGNFGVWRSDYLRVNGFDESFVGWGCEDDDFGMRLRRTGVQFKNAFQAIPTFHLWHPVDTSAPEKWKDGANAAYLHRQIRWTRCLNGIQKRGWPDLKVRVAGNDQARPWLRRILIPTNVLPPGSRSKSDIDVVVESAARFRRNTDCKVLVLPEPPRQLPSTAKQADVILTDETIDVPKGSRQFPLAGFPDFLETVATRRRTDTNRGTAA